MTDTAKPPIRRHGGAPRKWWPLLEPLTRKPGVWVRVSEGKRETLASVAQSLKGHNRVPYALPPGRWDACVRTAEHGPAILYVCYLGKGATDV